MRDPSREVRTVTDWPREILKIGTLEMRFPAMPLLASGQCYDFESHQCLFGTFRSDQCLFSTFRPDQSPFITTAAPSVRLLPLQYDYCPFSTTIAPSMRLLPLQYDCCPFSTTIAPSMRPLPLQYDYCQIRPISSQYDLRPSYATILSLILLYKLLSFATNFQTSL